MNKLANIPLKHANNCFNDQYVTKRHDVDYIT